MDTSINLTPTQFIFSVTDHSKEDSLKSTDQQGRTLETVEDTKTKLSITDRDRDSCITRFRKFLCSPISSCCFLKNNEETREEAKQNAKFNRTRNRLSSSYFPEGLPPLPDLAQSKAEYEKLEAQKLEAKKNTCRHNENTLKEEQQQEIAYLNNGFIQSDDIPA